MAKNIFIFLKFCIQELYTSGAVVEDWAADPKDVGSPPACALWFMKSWRVKRKITHFIKLYVISA
jgi:hypothetical protein